MQTEILTILLAIAFFAGIGVTALIYERKYLLGKRSKPHENE